MIRSATARWRSLSCAVRYSGVSTITPSDAVRESLALLSVALGDELI
jgi:hypothetical protein